ncbi:MAG: 5'-deoxyadenosine deaminase [Bacillota bacterium]
MATILIENGTVVTMNPKREILKGSVLIKDDRIEEISPDMGDVKADKIIDAAGMAVIPGLIQTHIHLTQSLLRGQADDLELLDWLKKRVWPLEGSHTAESNYYSAKLGIAELLKGGTTALVDMETVHHTDEAINAIYESGIRAVTGKCMMDYSSDVPKGLLENKEDSVRESVELLKKWHMKDGGRIKYAFTPRFVVSCTEELLIEVAKLAKEYDVMVHTHASENRGEIEFVEKDRGMRNVKYLQRIGLTGPNLILAHCIWLDDEEMKILADTGTKISHCPSSNMKLASGIAKIPELLEMGAFVSIGADGAPCNNNLDMFREMRNAAMIQKVRLLSPTAMPAERVFELATLGGAKAMGLENETGSLERGKKADIAIVNLDNLYSTPTAEVDIMSQLVYAVGAQDVVTTIVNGKVLMENRKLTTLDEREIKDNCNRLIKNQIQRSGISR